MLFAGRQSTRKSSSIKISSGKKNLQIPIEKREVVSEAGLEPATVSLEG